MIQKLDLWSKYILDARKRWKWLGYVLTGAAIIYIGILIVTSGLRLEDIHWNNYCKAIIISLFLFPISLTLQFIVWARLISYYRKTDWYDLLIYSRVILMRHLPGGVWHWIGRVSLYAGGTDVESRIIIKANFVEWAMFLLIAAAISLAGIDFIPVAIRIIIGIGIFGLATYIGFLWQPSHRHPVSRLIEASSWSLMNTISWAIGGAIFYLLIVAAGVNEIGYLRSTWIWSISGCISMMIFIIPAGSGIREIVLTWLLSPSLTVGYAVLTSVLIRLLFVLLDLVFGAIGMLVSSARVEKSQISAI